MKVKHTNELDGTLVVELTDGNVYEVARCNSGYNVLPDKGSKPPTAQQIIMLTNMYKQSSCFNR